MRRSAPDGAGDERGRGAVPPSGSDEHDLDQFAHQVAVGGGDTRAVGQHEGDVGGRAGQDDTRLVRCGDDGLGDTGEDRVVAGGADGEGLPDEAAASGVGADRGGERRPGDLESRGRPRDHGA